MIARTCDLCDASMPVDEMEDGGGIMQVFKRRNKASRPSLNMAGGLAALFSGGEAQGGEPAMEKSLHDICPGCVKGIFDTRDFLNRVRISKGVILSGEVIEGESIRDGQSPGLPPAPLVEFPLGPDEAGDRTEV